MNPKDIQMLSTTSLLTEPGIIYFDQRLVDRLFLVQRGLQLSQRTLRT
jgi:hypothetical protein